MTPARFIFQLHRKFISVKFNRLINNMFFYRKTLISTAKIINCSLPVLVLKLVFCLFACVCISVYAQAPLEFDPAKEITVTRSRLIQLTKNLEYADLHQQYDFIQISLLEMHRAYQAEINKSWESRPSTAKKKQKLMGWRHATQAFINDLDSYFLLLDSGVPFSLGVNRQQKVLIIIGIQPVIINGPGPAGHKQMEQRIVHEFCQIHNCSLYLDSITTLPGMSKNITDFQMTDANQHSSATSSANWLFGYGHNPVYMTGQGINCEFNNSSDRSNKEAACISLAKEVKQLSEVLKNTRHAGVRINLEYLSIKPLSDADIVQIQVNQQGNHIRQSLPLLKKNPELLFKMVPWLEENQDANLQDIVIDNADRLLNDQAFIH